MSTKTDRLQIEVGMNASQAEAELNKLKKTASDLRAELVEARKAGDTKLTRSLERDLKATNSEIRRFQTAMNDVDAVMQRLSKASVKELTAALKTVDTQLKKTERGTETFRRLEQQSQKLRTELAKVNKTLGAQTTAWDKMNIALNNCQTFIASAVASITALAMATRRAVDVYAEMAEQEANTRKYTGMTTQAVDELNESFKTMDTRLTREQLNLLAQEAGRLGHNTTTAVKEYVNGAKVVNVALCDLGEGATQTISKINNAFGLESRYGIEEAMNKTASVINVLSQNCSASKPYLVEFESRLAGVGTQAGMSVQEIAAFGAVLDSNNQKVEMSASATGRLISMLFAKPAEMARKAGLDVKKFTDTMMKDTTEGLLMFLEQINKLGADGGMAVLSPLFKDLGADGVRMTQVLATLAGHVDEVRWQIGEANKAFREGTSAMNEYQIFNNTPLARLEKARKSFHEVAVTVGKELSPAMEYMYTSGRVAMKALSAIVQVLGGHLKEITVALATVAGAMAAYRIATNLQNIQLNLLIAKETIHNGLIKAKTNLLGLLKGSYYLAAAGVQRLTGNTVAASASMAKFNAVCKANVFMAVVGAVLALVTALSLLNRKSDEAKKELEAMNRASEEAGKKQAEAAQTVKESREAIEKLIDAEGRCTEGKGKEKVMCDKLNATYGQTLGHYETLAEWYDVLTRKGDKYAESLYNQTKQAARLGYAQELLGQAAKLRDEGENYDPGVWETLWANFVALQTPNPESWSESRARLRNEKNADNTAKAAELEARAKAIQADVDKERREQQPLNYFKNAELRDARDKLKKEVAAAEKDGGTVAIDLGDKVIYALIPTKENVTVRATSGNNLPAEGEGLAGRPSRVGKGQPVLTPYKDADAMAADGWKETIKPGVYERASKPDGNVPLAQAKEMLAVLEGQVLGRGMEEEKGDITPYQSQSGSGGSSKADAARKKAFRAAWDKIKNERSFARTKVNYQSMAGELDYEEVLKENKKIEEKYYRDSISLFKKFRMTQEDEYGKLFEARSKMRDTYEEKEDSLLRERIEAETARETQEENFRYENHTKKTLADEIKHQEELYRIKERYYDRLLDTYSKGDKEHHELERKRADEAYQYLLERTKLINKAWQTLTGGDAAGKMTPVDLSATADVKSLKELTELVGALKELGASPEESVVDALKHQVRNGLGGKKSSSDKMTEAQNKFDREKGKLDAAKEAGALSDEDYADRLNSLKAELDATMFDGLLNSQDKFISNTAKMVLGWKQFAEALQDGSLEDKLGAIAGGVAATAAAVCQGLSIASEFAQAEAEEALKKLEKRYNKEVSLAEGNTYKLKQLEENKAKEEAKIKNEASEKAYAMQIIEATATSIVAALNAYSSTMAIPVVGPALAPIAAAVALASGVAQVALLKKQRDAAKAEGYADGGFTPGGPRLKEVGTVHAGEWVAPQRLVNSPETRALIDRLEYARVHNRMPAVESVPATRAAAAMATALPMMTPAVAPTTAPAVAAPDLSPYMAEQSRLLAALEKRLGEPIAAVTTVAGDSGINRAQAAYEKLIRNKSPKFTRRYRYGNNN